MMLGYAWICKGYKDWYEQQKFNQLSAINDGIVVKVLSFDDEIDRYHVEECNIPVSACEAYIPPQYIDFIPTSDDFNIEVLKRI